MKLFFASIFLAFVSAPIGFAAGVFFLSHSIGPDLDGAASFGGVINGIFLFVALVLFLISMVRMKIAEIKAQAVKP